jgi:imidazolonepropionase-like amidohydrolase
VRGPLAFVLIAGVAGAAPPAGGDDRVAYVDVRVVDPETGRVRPGLTVVTDGDRIAAVGPTAEVVVPPGAVRVEGRGRYLAPGLADMHVHLHFAEELPLYLARGITTVRNMRGAPEHLEWRADVAAGRRPGPRITTSGPTLGGSPLVNPVFTAVDDVSTARVVVARQKADGYDFVKVHSRLRPEVYDAIAAEARARGIAVVGHFIREVGLDRALRGGQASLEHAGDLAAAGAPADVAAALARSGTAVGTLFTATYLRNPPASSVAELWRAPAQAYAPPGTEERALARALGAAGVRLLPGTDASLPPMRPGESLGLELRFLVEAGLDPAAVFRAATAGAGAFLRAHLGGPPSGLVAPGARADLVLLEEDPLRDPAAALRPVEVVAGGRRYDDAQLRPWRGPK